MVRSLFVFFACALALGLVSTRSAAAQEPSTDDAGVVQEGPETSPAGATDAPPPSDETAPSEGSEGDDDAAPTDEAGRAEDSEEARDAAREQLRAARVGELAARTRVALHTARPLVRASGDVTRIDRAMPGTEAEIRRLSHPSRLARIPHLSQRELADLRGDWRRHAHRLENWQATIAQRETEVEEVRTVLVELKRTWQDLRDLSETAGSPEPRHGRIVAGLEETRHGLAELEAARDELAALSDRVSDVQIIVEEVAEQLRDAASVYRERLLVRDAPPITEGWADDDAADASVAAQARETLLERTETPDELLAELVPPVLALVVAFFAIYMLLRHLDGSRGKAGERSSLGALALEVLRHPGSSSALLCLLAANVLIEQAPIFVYDAIFFATLFPLWRAMPPLTPPPLHPALKGLIVFVAFDRAQSMLAEGSSLLRLVLLVEAIGALGALAVWLRGTSREAPLWSRMLGLFALALFGVAALANLSGYLFLATVLTRGVGFSAYTGVALAGAVVVTEAIIDLVVVSELGRRLRMFREHAALVHERTLRLFTFAAIVTWSVATLEGFGLWGPFSSSTEKLLRDDHEIGSLEISFGEVLGALGILVATHLILRLVRFVLELDVLPRLSLEPGVDGAIAGLTSYLVGGTGLLFALAYLGIDASQIALVAGALGVGIGFGLQGIVANFIAGIVLMIERPVRLGDFIEVGSLVGSVERIGLRSSTVKALDGAEVIVPNESLISREVVNWTLSDRKRRVEVKVGVAYGTDPHRVVEILRRVAVDHRDPTVSVDPEVLFEAFGESSLDFTLQFWATSFADSIELKSEVGLAVHDALTAAGIEIPFPQRDLHIVTQTDRSGSGSGSPSAVPDRAPEGSG